MKEFFTAALFASILAACGVSENKSSVAQGTLSSADQWCHIPLKATDGTLIQVDYRYNGPYGRSGVVDITPLWVNVTRPAGTANSNVRAVLINYSYNSPQNFQQDLQRDTAQHFSGQFARFSDLYGSYKRTEIAVVVDSQWLKDPISGKTNFQIDLFKNIGNCR